MKILFILVLTYLLFPYSDVYCAQDRVEGLEYELSKLEDVPLDKAVVRNYFIYELDFENKSNKTFSIPGYSLDLGVDYSSLSEINSLNKDKSSKKLALLNIAAGAASIAFGGIAKTAANTAMRSVNSFKHRNNLTEDSFLSGNKTYILYPNDGISIFFLLAKSSGQNPQSIRFVCHDEDLNLNYVVINNNLKLKEFNAHNNSNQNVIATPTSEQYK